MRTLLVFIVGLLLGANAVYFAMTRYARPDCPRECPAPSESARPIPASPTTRSPVAAAPAPADSPVATLPAPAPSPAIASAHGGLGLPVRGLTVDQLQDTFSDARGSERRHEAMDIAAPAGTEVLAVADGRIEKLFTSAQGGLTIYQFEPTGQYAYYYAHLQGYAPGLREDQAVVRGQLLGYVGSTGNANPSAPHLHFAVFELGPEKQWWKGTAINPYPLLGGRH
ncbi:M23 family metallopeptidase [Agrilutibacter solisilvae]|uniref:M23 family metallopeptidase n=1 Tax=Agrilutibacter solisilvae TaxID=2763317 RepID=UPI00190A1593|nr:M23 family metallopeptidase [Lysobacter solisilvae]